MPYLCTVTRTAAVVILLSFLSSCRVTPGLATVDPAGQSYPGPQAQRPASAPAATWTAALAVESTATTAPRPEATATARPHSTATPEVEAGAVAFTLTILYTGEVAELVGQAEIVIVLSNLTVAENEALALQVPGIDVLLGARDIQAKRGVRALAGPDGPVIVAVTYRQGQFLGQLTVHFDGAGRVVSFGGQDLALNDKYAADPAMLELLAQYGVTP